MNSGINPNWLEDHKASVWERDVANSLIELRDYKIPQGKDYLKSLQVAGRKQLREEEISDLEFAPLIDFLELNMKEQKESIISFMMFMGISSNNFEYKNHWTRQYIVIDRTGRVVSQDAYALWHDEE